MCKNVPCRCSCELVPVADRQAVHDGPAGAWCVAGVQDGDLNYRLFWVKLPNGNGTVHALPIRPANPERASWDFDGNMERPTLSPSVLTWRSEADGTGRAEDWHGFIKNGRAESC
jgi:hypothetical protein